VLAEDAWFCQRCGNPVPLWGLRVAAGALVLVAAAMVTFAVLVFVFGLFVE
jgi:hypothetical protein